MQASNQSVSEWNAAREGQGYEREKEPQKVADPDVQNEPDRKTVTKKKGQQDERGEPRVEESIGVPSLALRVANPDGHGMMTDIRKEAEYSIEVSREKENDRDRD